MIDLGQIEVFVKKRRFAIAIIIFFLALAASSPDISEAQNSALSPPMRITEHLFKEVYATVSVAFSVYKMDAMDGLSMENIIDKHRAALIGADVKFDLEHMDLRRKGWTRHYPVSIRGENFIVRLFLTGERAYQPALPVLFEMDIKDPDVTCQILPDINSILGPAGIKPLRPTYQRQTSASL